MPTARFNGVISGDRAMACASLPMSQLKAVKAHSGTPGMVELFQMVPPILVSTVMESLPADQAPQILGANLIVSNVRGNPVPMYIAGARMDAMFPMSILTAGMGINVTCVSYSKDMHFGIVVDPNLVSGQHALAEGLELALAEFVALCAVQSGIRPDTKARATTTPPAKRRATSSQASSTAVSGAVKQQPAVKRARAGGAGSRAKKSAASTGPASTR